MGPMVRRDGRGGKRGFAQAGRAAWSCFWLRELRNKPQNRVIMG